jgi:hypothetical protein
MRVPPDEVRGSVNVAGQTATAWGSGSSDTVTFTGQVARRAATVAPVNTPADATLDPRGRSTAVSDRLPLRFFAAPRIISSP